MLVQPSCATHSPDSSNETEGLTEMSIRVLLVDDHQLIREGLQEGVRQIRGL